MNLVRWGLAAAFAVLCSGAVAQAAVVVIERALFELQGQTPQSVPLPDSWAARGVPLASVARYRLQFELTATPDEPWALILGHVAAEAQMRLNGVALGPPPVLRSSRPVSQLVPLPAEALRAGSNELSIDLAYETLAGLSAAKVGPARLLQPEYRRLNLLTRNLPQALNAAAFGVALLMLLVWWRQRSLVAIGAFAGLALLGSLRGMFTFVGGESWRPSAGPWLTYVSHLWSTVLLGAFAQAFAERKLPRFVPTLCWAAGALTVASLWADLQGGLLSFRRWTYPLVIAGTLPSLWLCLRRAGQARGVSRAAQAGAAVALVGAGVHDYAMQTLGLLPVTQGFWMPFVVPLMVMAVAAALIERVTSALGRVAGLNVELETRVAQRTRELESANLAKTRFLASASHDLRQPLTSIGLLVGLAREQASSPVQREMLDRADESVAAMESLMSGLLDLSRLEGGVVQVRRQPVPLAELWAAIEAHESGTAQHKGLRLRFRPTGLVVDTDPVMLERVLRNLVVNAIRYTPQGSVLVAARRRGGRVRIEVRDSGIGIAAHDQDRVFDEFVQLSAADRTRGLGLGLAIVRRSLVLLGHEIELRSAPGRGSCFAITLEPAHRASAAADASPAEPSGNALASRRLVLVEDDPVVREALRLRLEAWGASVSAFEDVQSLQEWLSGPHDAPDLAICDFQLPGGSGLDAISALKRRHGEAFPAILMTGDTAPRDLVQLHRSDTPVLHKPFRSEAMLALVQRALTGR